MSLLKGKGLPVSVPLSPSSEVAKNNSGGRNSMGRMTDNRAWVIVYPTILPCQSPVMFKFVGLCACGWPVPTMCEIGDGAIRGMGRSSLHMTGAM